MNTKETSADKTKYRLAEAAKMCMAASGTDAMTVTQIVQTCGGRHFTGTSRTNTT